MSLKLPRIAGHRGAAAYAPENTLEGIHTAADMDVEWVELDVKLTKDGVPIIFHDDTLDRTTNGAGPVAEADYSHIRELEAGSWFSDSFAGIKIPSLEEAIEVLIERDLGLNLEIKPCPGREIETAEAALDVLSQYWDDHERLLISSFQQVSLESARDLARDWNRALLIGDNWPDNLTDLADYLELKCVNFNASSADEETVRRVIEAGFKTCAYTVNDPDLAREMQSWGVNCLITDVPDLIGESILSIH